jgi:UDP-glucose 4-epimerase
MSSDSINQFKQGDLALVIGATGFIGQRLVAALQQRGYRVRVYSRRDYAANVLPGVASDDWFSGVLEDADTLTKACTGVAAVFHLANIAHVNTPDEEALLRVNVEGTEAVCRACLGAGVSRLVYFSSSLATDPARSPYAESKRAAEQPVLAAGKDEAAALHVSVLRPVNVYGAGMRGNIAGLIGRIVKGSIPPLPRLQNRLALISVDDLCRAALAAAAGRQPSGKIYTLADGEAYTPNRLEEAVYAAMGRKRPGWHSPRVLFYAAAAAAQLADLAGIWKNDLGLRTYHNLVSDQAGSSDGFANDFDFKPSQSLESELPRILRSLE